MGFLPLDSFGRLCACLASSRGVEVMLKGWRWLAGASLTAGAVLILAVVGAVPALQNKGDIWTQPAGTADDPGHSQDVHLPCGSVDIWGDGLAQSSGTWVLYHLPPPNADQSQVASGTYSYN